MKEYGKPLRADMRTSVPCRRNQMKSCPYTICFSLPEQRRFTTQKMTKKTKDISCAGFSKRQAAWIRRSKLKPLNTEASKNFHYEKIPSKTKKGGANASPFCCTRVMS